MSVREEVRAEERAARERQAHMDRMVRESLAARATAGRGVKREQARVLRGQIRAAESAERTAHREYERWGQRYSDASDEQAEAMGSICDQKFKDAMTATDTVQRLRRELEEL